jgi:putative FmdB family regulatory protein
MPRYDYECRDCGHFFEVKQSFHDDALTECPKCKGSIRRVIAPVGIVFKGGGYYVTDTRGAEKSGVAAAEPSTAGEGETQKVAAEGSGKETSAGSATGEGGDKKQGSKEDKKKKSKTEGGAPKSSGTSGASGKDATSGTSR